MKKLIIALAALSLSSASFATNLTTKISVDNGFSVYVSTDDSSPGTLFGSGNDWTTTFVDAVALSAGVDYFLHVYGYDQGGVAGFLGEFLLDSADHVFSNGTGTLLTNTVDWAANATGFNGAYGSVISLGTNGVGPWGVRPNISGSAQWIWTSAADAVNENYFTTKISAKSVRAVPDAGSTSVLLGLAIVALGAASRRRNAAR